MTTPEEALAHALNPTDDEKALITAAVNDPLIQVWPEIDGQQKGILVASSALMQALNVVCSFEGNIDAEAAVMALGAVRDHIRNSIPEMSKGERESLESQGAKVAKLFRTHMEAWNAADVGDEVGTLRVGEHSIPMKKSPPPDAEVA